MDRKWICTMALCAAFAVCASSPEPSYGITAQDILRQVMEQHMGESFRTVLTVTSPTSSKKNREFSLWLAGAQGQGSLSYFLEFDRPREVQGMRFLVLRSGDTRDRCFMYLPASGDTVPVAADDPNFSIGGTGLTIESMPGFLPREIQSATLLDDEKVGAADCWVVSIPAWKDRARRNLWVTKQGKRIVRIRRANEDGSIREESKTLSFFETADGHYLPREIEIRQIQKDKHIRVFTHHGVFNISIPEELLDPKLFGTFKWRIGTE